MTTKSLPHLNVFIGYDERQDLAYKVCRESLLQTTTQPLSIYPLKHRTLREIGLLKREWSIKQNGLTVDDGDNRPFSTNFAFSRFLVPAYAKYLGCSDSDVSMFVDSDFVFLRDPYVLLQTYDIFSKPVWCVKHDYKSPNIIKMDNQSQKNYNKKLWSSLMVFNMSDIHCGPTVDETNTQTGAWLHGFEWLNRNASDTGDVDTSIGSLSENWNFIPEHSEPRVQLHDVCAIHYTEGTPLMYPGCKYAEIFNNVLRSVLNKALSEPEILG